MDPHQECFYNSFTKDPKLLIPHSAGSSVTRSGQGIIAKKISTNCLHKRCRDCLFYGKNFALNVLLECQFILYSFLDLYLILFHAPNFCSLCLNLYYQARQAWMCMHNQHFFKHQRLFVILDFYDE